MSAESHSAGNDAPCIGSGGVVYTVEGPQFGPQVVEEPCEVCFGWHKRFKPCYPKTGWLSGETYCARHGRKAGWPCRVIPPGSTHPTDGGQA